MEVRIPKVNCGTTHRYQVGYKIKGPGNYLGNEEIYHTGIDASCAKEAVKKVKEQVAKTKYENPILKDTWHSVEISSVYVRDRTVERKLDLQEIRWIFEGLKLLSTTRNSSKLNNLREEFGNLLEVLEDAEMAKHSKEAQRTVIDDILSKLSVEPLRKLPPNQLEMLVRKLNEDWEKSRDANSFELLCEVSKLIEGE